MAKTNFTKLSGAVYFHPGASKTRSYEDRSFFGKVVTASGLEFHIAIVSDGVGGGNLGQRAAQLTVDTILEHIALSTKLEKEIPQILGAAIGAANKKVYVESRSAREKDGMSATVAVAVICKGRLYVANVGDSRVYLLQEGKTLKQVTIDHTFLNEKVKQGIAAEKLVGHPNANAIVRSVGFEPEITVDLGLYLNNGQEDGRQAFSNQGLVLNASDVILVCSDGLIKEISNDEHHHYVEGPEIIDAIHQFRADDAAKVLVDLAVGRNVDDNVTAVIVEFTGRKVLKIPTRSKVIYGVSTVLALGLIFVALQLGGAMGKLNQLTQANIDNTNTAVIRTAMALSFTPTQSPTPRPTLIPGEIGAIVIGGNRQPFLVNMPISVSAYTEVHVNHTGEFEDGKIYLLEQSKILFEVPPADTMSFVVFPETQLFVYPGRYSAGAGMRLANAKGIVDFSVSGSCMAIDYRNEKVVASCYEGVCSYKINYGEETTISVGNEIELDINTLIAGEENEIRLMAANSWLNLLPLGSHARQCVSAVIPKSTTPTPNRDDGNGENEPNIGLTSNPGTEPPVVTEPPATEPPATEPPATEPPATEPPATEPPQPTDPPGNDKPPKEKPTDPPTESPTEPTG